MSPRSRTKKQGEERLARNAAEWTTLVVSLLIISFLIGYSVYHGIVTGREVPKVDVTARVSDAVKLGGQYAVPVTVQNRSRQTAQDVHVLVEAEGQGKTHEREMIIDFLPEEGEVRGYVVFDFKPARGKTKAQVTLFKIP